MSLAVWRHLVHVTQVQVFKLALHTFLLLRCRFKLAYMLMNLTIVSLCVSASMNSHAEQNMSHRPEKGLQQKCVLLWACA
jgi:hypothetical protein